ncbi:MAG: bifunctional riboflavin kinase/FAD synthetase [Oscillospiraceae bacterium]|nr:bifunctional riboflavin kinase/FAD synthetase [Oscillospiraceae bacterium]
MSELRRAVALGFFDGVHLGHAALLERVKERAAEKNAEPTVMTFDVHPDTLVFGKEVLLINSAPEREEIIRRVYGIDTTIFLHFNRSMMQMPWQEFISSAVEELGIVSVVVGHDFSFGYRGEGKPERLKAWCEERGISCDIIPAVKLDGRVVSSTEIRVLIADGKIEEANRLLGHPHTLSDVIHSGYHLGTKLGSPTINMAFPAGVLIPRHGVYAAKVWLDDDTSYEAVTNVGVRPTVSEGERVSVESHLLDFSGNLYGRHARVEFMHFQRPEARFESVEELSEQIRRDTEETRAWFRQHEA